MSVIHSAVIKNIYCLGESEKKGEREKVKHMVSPLVK